MKNKRLISIAFALVMVLSFAFGSLENTRLISKSIIANAEESFATAKSISLNQEYSNALSKTNYKQYYKFKILNDGYINIDFGKDFLDGYYYDWDMTVYNQLQQVIKTQSFKVGNSVTETTCDIGVGKGTYYIEITTKNNFYAPSSRYYLRVNYNKSSVWEKELNNDYKNANIFSVNCKFYGALQNSEDRDYYKITIPQKGQYDISFGKDYSESEHPWKLTIYNSNMIEVYKFQSTLHNSAYDIYTALLDSGTYYIMVDAYYYKPPLETYSITIAPIPVNVPDVTGMKAIATTAQAIKLTWNKVPNATGYVLYIYNKSSKKWERVAVTKNNMYVVTKLNHGEAYAFTARAYRTVNGKNYYSQSFKNFKTSTKPAAVSFWVNSKSRNNATISWNKVNGATSYIVYYKSSPNGAWKRIAHVNNRTTSFTKSGLKSGSTGYFTVRAFRTYEGVTYGSTFVTKNVRIK